MDFSARSSAIVTIPSVEQDPHFRDIRCIRTMRGAALKRSDQKATRRRSWARRSLCFVIVIAIEQDREDRIDDASALILAKS